MGDHRTIMLDIPQHSLLGDEVQTIVHPTSRRLQCNIYEVQTNYNNTFELYCAERAIKRKRHSLFTPTYLTSVKMITTIKSIDNVMIEDMINA